MRSSISRHRNCGFTLRDLLCVAALFSFFGALIIPTDLGTGRQYVEKANCRSNLKQILLGFMQYRNDWDERCPLVFVTDGEPYGWADALQPYIRDTNVFQCPTDTNQASVSPNESGYTDYWYNANAVIRFERGDRIYFTGPDAIHILGKERIVLFGDGGNMDGSGGHNSTYNQCGDGSSLSGRNQICAPSKSLKATYPAAQIHLGGANFAFVDGHIKWIKADNASQSAKLKSNRAGLSALDDNFAFWVQRD